MSNVDPERERINRLKHYVNQISIHTYSLKYDLINEIEKGNITNTNEIKNFIEEFEKPYRNKAENLKIIHDYNLDDTSKQTLESKIDNDEITTKEELKKEIENEKIRTEYRKIINEIILDDYSQSNIVGKINNNMIKTIEELKKEITEEKNKTDLRKIVEHNTYIGYTSKSELNSRINQNEIKTENQLKEELENEKQKIELRKIGMRNELVRKYQKLKRESENEEYNSNDDNHESYGGNYYKNLYG